MAWVCASRTEAARWATALLLQRIEGRTEPESSSGGHVLAHGVAHLWVLKIRGSEAREVPLASTARAAAIAAPGLATAAQDPVLLGQRVDQFPDRLAKLLRLARLRVENGRALQVLHDHSTHPVFCLHVDVPRQMRLRDGGGQDGLPVVAEPL